MESIQNSWMEEGIWCMVAESFSNQSLTWSEKSLMKTLIITMCITHVYSIWKRSWMLCLIHVHSFHLYSICKILLVQYLFFDLITCIMIRTEKFFTIISKLLETILWCINVTLIQKENKLNQLTILWDDTLKVQCNKLLKNTNLIKQNSVNTACLIPCAPDVAPKGFQHLQHLLLIHHSGSKLSFHLWMRYGPCNTTAW